MSRAVHRQAPAVSRRIVVRLDDAAMVARFHDGDDVAAQCARTETAIDQTEADLIARYRKRKIAVWFDWSQS